MTLASQKNASEKGCRAVDAIERVKVQSLICACAYGGGGRIRGRPVPLPVIRPPRDFASLASVGGGRFGGTIRYYAIGINLSQL